MSYSQNSVYCCFKHNLPNSYPIWMFLGSFWTGNPAGYGYGLVRVWVRVSSKKPVGDPHWSLLIIDIAHLLIDTVSLIASSSLCSHCLVISMSLVVVTPPSPLHLHANHAPWCPIVFTLCQPSQMCLQTTRYCFPFQSQSPYRLLALVSLTAPSSLHPLPPWNLCTPHLLVIFALLAVFMPLAFYAPHCLCAFTIQNLR